MLNFKSRYNYTVNSKCGTQSYTPPAGAYFLFEVGKTSLIYFEICHPVVFKLYGVVSSVKKHNYFIVIWLNDGVH